MASVLAVLLAIFALPFCPRIAFSAAAGNDLLTVTEGRSVIERFAQPGTYALHGVPAEAPCATCESDHRAPDRQVAPQVVAVDILPAAREATVAPVSAGDLLPIATSRPLPGLAARVPSPPPRPA